ncbi:MAG: winged helix-turn-helix transcriptional regulator [Clostridia bacterium]|nr:winged helix-turn-helix transcriptional regulator [Clostridia bacterium]
METRFTAFTVLIAKIGRAIHKIKTEEMAEFNLKSSHVTCLYYLYKTGGITAKELCDISSEDKSNISRAIKHLEGEGYLYCNTSKAKRYQDVIRLTDKGANLGKRLAQKIDRIEAAAGRFVSDDAREVLYKSLASICDNLEAICGDYDRK